LSHSTSLTLRGNCHTLKGTDDLRHTTVRDSSSQAPHRGASFSPYCSEPPRRGHGTRICMLEWMVGVGAFPYRRDPPTCTRRTGARFPLTGSSVQQRLVPRPCGDIDPQVGCPPHNPVLETGGSNLLARSDRGIEQPGAPQPDASTWSVVLHHPMEHRSRQEILAPGRLGRIRPGETIPLCEASLGPLSGLCNRIRTFVTPAPKRAQVLHATTPTTLLCLTKSAIVQAYCTANRCASNKNYNRVYGYRRS